MEYISQQTLGLPASDARKYASTKADFTKKSVGSGHAVAGAWACLLLADKANEDAAHWISVLEELVSNGQGGVEAQDALC
jgi:hypothetical protein